MSVALAPSPKFQGIGFGGLPLIGGKLFTYIAGTSTPQATYTDSTQIQQNTNPVILNSNGQADVWLVVGDTYKFVLQDIFGNLVWTVDQIPGGLSAQQIGLILYPITPAESAASVTPRNFAIPPYHVLRYGTNSNPGTTDMTGAIQNAIDVAAQGPKQVIFDPGNYLITTCLNGSSDSTHDRSAIQYLGAARRGAVTITGQTNNWMLDISGSPWVQINGIFFVSGSTNPSWGGIVACTTTTAQPSFLSLLNCYIQLYAAATAPATFGTIGVCLFGSEEDTIFATQVFANTCYLIVTAYSLFSSGYPSPFQNANVISNQSQGVTTFSGENSAVTFDAKFPNISMFGANTIDFGNMYLANINIGTPGTAYKGISILGGTLEGAKGQFKLESKQTLLSIDSTNAQVMGWNLLLTFGAGITTTNGCVEINPGGSTVFSGNLNSIKLGVHYEAPTSISGKPLILYSGTMDGGATAQSLSNIEVETNQTVAQAAQVPMLPRLFNGTVNSYNLRFTDVNYVFNGHSQKKIFKTAADLGPGNASAPAAVMTITLPAVSAGFSARSIAVRARGMVSSVAEPGGGTDTNLTVAPFDTVVSSFSPANGTIVLSTGTSDKCFTPSNSALSVNAGLFQYTGVSLTQAIASRVITVSAAATGTGSSLSAIEAFGVGMEIEMQTSGRIGDSIYIT